jgi:3-oxoacyl-[acyl-carrier protein] reductase
MKLQDRVAIVTGAGTGMGRAIAERFAAEGAKVVVNYRASQAEAEEVAAGIRERGGQAVAWRADIAVDADVRAMMNAVEERLGRLDVLVNNAGWSKIVPHHQLDDLTDEIWDRTLNTNLRGTFYCSRAAASLLAKQPGSSIINISSAAAWHSSGSSIVYGAAKAGVVNMTRAMARVLAPGIRVNGIAPGYVPTGFAGRAESDLELRVAQIPLARVSTPDEIAAVAVFLAADATSMTGETLVVDGGRTRLNVRR